MIPNYGDYKNSMYTIVSAYFDLGRDKWKSNYRPADYYLENGKRLCSIDAPMVLFVEAKHVNIVKEYRHQYLDKTWIVPAELNKLPYIEFQKPFQDLLTPSTGNQQDDDLTSFLLSIYQTILISKLDFILNASEINPFKTSHFVWLDFGLNPSIPLHQPLLNKIPDKIKLLCTHYPEAINLTNQPFNYFKTSLISGHIQTFRALQPYFYNALKYCLSNKILPTEQLIFSQLFLKYPHLFELYYGKPLDIFANYNEVKQSLMTVLHIAFTCRNTGNIQGFEEIMDTIKHYSSEMWNC